MQKRVSPLFGIGISALAVMLLGASNVPQIPVPAGAATIVNLGNDDYTGFRIVVRPDGRAAAVDATGKSSSDLSFDLSNRFFTDLRAAAKASKDTSARCTSSPDLAMDNAAVNADVSIAWSGRRWSNVSCAPESALVALRDDATAIEQALYVQAYRARPIYVYVGRAYGSDQGGQVYGQTYRPSSVAGGYTMGYGASPYAGAPSGQLPTTSLPTSGLSANFPAGSLPFSSPYTGLPTSGLPGASIGGSSPYTGAPYTGI